VSDPDLTPHPKVRRLRMPLLVVALALAVVAGIGVFLVNRDPAGRRDGGDDNSPDRHGRPIEVSENGRYLVDHNGRPWMMAADTAWSIFSKLNAAEVSTYLDSRKSTGFNTVAISVVDPTSGGVQSTVNQTRDHLFNNNSIADPDDQFFATVDDVVAQAEGRGMTVIIFPLWLRFAHEDPTFTTQNVERYGQFLGQRYRDDDNIIWAMGGDFGGQTEGLCPDQAEVRALAESIKAADPRHLMTYHPGTDLSTSTCYNEDDWVDFNSTYWDFNFHNMASAYKNVLRDYNSTPRRPALMLESGYEGPHPGDDDPNALTARTSRIQSYYMILAGGLGFTYGANSTYYTDNTSPAAIRSWQQTLDIPGAAQQGYVAKLFQSHSWWALAPDQDHRAVVSGYGTFGEQDYVTTGRADNGGLVISYLPTERTITVDMGALSGPVTAQWYDPTSGVYLTIATGQPNTGLSNFAPPGKNSVGDDDWVLILDANA